MEQNAEATTTQQVEDRGQLEQALSDLGINCETVALQPGESY